MEYIDPKPFGGIPPNDSYGQTDWIDDWNWHSRVSLEYGLARSEEFQRTILPDYFRTKYGNRAKFHYRRVLRALNYIVRHASELDEGSTGIQGRGLFVPGRALVLALWKVYSECPENFLDTDWPVEKVKVIAAKFGT